MYRYETSAPRVAFGMVAVAMSVITLGVMVVMPAQTGSDGPEPRMLATSKATPLTPVSLITTAGRDLGAARESGAARGCIGSKPDRKPEG